MKKLILLLVLSAVCIVLFLARALPVTHPLYPIKIYGTESLIGLMHWSLVSRAEYAMHRADARMNEALQEKDTLTEEQHLFLADAARKSLSDAVTIAFDLSERARHGDAMIIQTLVSAHIDAYLPAASSDVDLRFLGRMLTDVATESDRARQDIKLNAEKAFQGLSTGVQSMVIDTVNRVESIDALLPEKTSEQKALMERSKDLLRQAREKQRNEFGDDVWELAKESLSLALRASIPSGEEK